MSDSPQAARAVDWAAIQRWMQSIIVHPHGVAAGLESDDARRHLDVPPAEIEELIAPSQTLSGLERLSIYSRAYTARLLECLRAAYPTVADALGSDAFDALAVGYLQTYPSRSYTLDKLGSRFAQFLDQTRPDRQQGDVSRQGRNVNWPDLLIDLARLDWAIGQVFDGPGAEDQSPLSARQIHETPPDRWPDARLAPTPSLRLLAFCYPVNAYFSAVRAGQDPPLPEPEDTYLALTRRDFVVCRHELSRPQFEMLTALAGGETIGEAISRAAKVEVDVDRLIAELREWFRDWTANQFFLAIQ